MGLVRQMRKLRRGRRRFKDEASVKLSTTCDVSEFSSSVFDHDSFQLGNFHSYQDITSPRGDHEETQELLTVSSKSDDHIFTFDQSDMAGGARGRTQPTMREMIGIPDDYVMSSDKKVEADTPRQGKNPTQRKDRKGGLPNILNRRTQNREKDAASSQQGKKNQQSFKPVQASSDCTLTAGGVGVPMPPTAETVNGDAGLFPVPQPGSTSSPHSVEELLHVYDDDLATLYEESLKSGETDDASTTGEQRLVRPAAMDEYNIKARWEYAMQVMTGMGQCSDNSGSFYGSIAGMIPIVDRNAYIQQEEAEI